MRIRKIVKAIRQLEESWRYNPKAPAIDGGTAFDDGTKKPRTKGTTDYNSWLDQNIKDAQAGLPRIDQEKASTGTPRFPDSSDIRIGTPTTHPYQGGKKKGSLGGAPPPPSNDWHADLMQGIGHIAHYVEHPSGGLDYGPGFHHLAHDAWR